MQICHGGEKGIVRIELTSEHMGSLKGEFQVRDGVVNGCFMGNHRETVMNLRRSSDIFGSYLPQELRTAHVLGQNRTGRADGAGGPVCHGKSLFTDGQRCGETDGLNVWRQE